MMVKTKYRLCCLIIILTAIILVIECCQTSSIISVGNGSKSHNLPTYYGSHDSFRKPRRRLSESEVIISTPPSRDAGHPESLVDCSALLNQVRAQTQWDPNDSRLYARYTDFQFWVSVHNPNYDSVRYSTFERGKYYELDLSMAFVEVLNETTADTDVNNSTLVIDIGGNIGWFSLLSASLGAEVHVFEPNIVNVIRLCESLCLNGWEDCDTIASPYTVLPIIHNDNKQNNVQIRTLGLKDSEGDFWLSSSGGTSPGSGKIQNIKKSEDAVQVKVTTLDLMAQELDWFHRDISILKVDVEGLEHPVFMGGQKLLASGRVQNIFMEGNVGKRPKMRKFQDLCERFVLDGYYVHKFGGYTGPDSTLEFLSSDLNFCEKLLLECRGGAVRKELGKDRAQCNIWWKLNRRGSESAPV